MLTSDIENRISFQGDKSEGPVYGVHRNKSNIPPHRNRDEFGDGSVNVLDGTQVPLEHFKNAIPNGRVGRDFNVVDSYIVIVEVRGGTDY